MDRDDEPSEVSAQRPPQFLEISKDRLSMRYVGNGTHGMRSNVGSIQANRPVPRDRTLYYFELKVLNGGEHGKIGVGFSDASFRSGYQPGWEPNSYGYHGDDGHKFSSSGHGAPYGPRFSTGDVIGACVHLEKREIFYTKNGKHLGVAFRDVPPLVLFPTVGLHSKDECVELNFGKQPFAFDLEGYIRAEQQQHNEELNRVSVPVDTSHHIVRQYLMHYGYADTLAAFDRVAGFQQQAGVPSSSTANSAPCVQASSLPLRKQLREQLRGGDVEGCLQLLGSHFPQLVSSAKEPAGSEKNGLIGKDVLNVASSHLQLHFWLNCQTYVELIRWVAGGFRQTATCHTQRAATPACWTAAAAQQRLL